MSNRPTTTRREFLAQTSAALAALALIPAAVSPQITLSGPLSGFLPPAQRPAYGPPERTALIDDWYKRVDRATVALESLCGFLLEARSLAPEQVDAEAYIGLRDAASEQMTELGAAIEEADSGDLFAAMTGRDEWEADLTYFIKNGGGNREQLQNEVDCFRLYRPAQAEKLQGLLDTHYPA